MLLSLQDEPGSAASSANVDSEGWKDLGGSTGSLQELNGNLIITNTPTNHRSIEGLLAQRRL